MPGVGRIGVELMQLRHACRGCGGDVPQAERSVEVGPRHEFMPSADVVEHVRPGGALILRMGPSTPDVAPLEIRDNSTSDAQVGLRHRARQLLPGLGGVLVLLLRPSAPVHYGALRCEGIVLPAPFHFRLLTSTTHRLEGILQGDRLREDAMVQHLCPPGPRRLAHERKALGPTAAPGVGHRHALVSGLLLRVIDLATVVPDNVLLVYRVKEEKVHLRVVGVGSQRNLKVHGSFRNDEGRIPSARRCEVLNTVAAT
mmetsp:Transcript_105246/g.224821  ORF Transcript_105246/g.224821 Transcript_105246/m.224821 type:complete len:256 (-) Transcript_105246:263-1030(-)